MVVVVGGGGDGGGGQYSIPVPVPVPVQHVKKKKKLYRYRSLCALVHGSVLPVPVLCPYGYCLWFAIKVFRLAGFGWR